MACTVSAWIRSMSGRFLGWGREIMRVFEPCGGLHGLLNDRYPPPGEDSAYPWQLLVERGAIDSGTG